MCIGILAIGLIFLVWYPEPLGKALGVTHISILLLSIDVILGPVLGFIVFKEGKKTLKMDLLIIIALQLSALSYGLYNIYQGRPAWLVFQNDYFDLIRSNDAVSDQGTGPSNLLKPQFKAVDAGQTLLKKKEYLAEDMQSGIPAFYRVERYVSIEKSADQIVSKMRDLKNFNNAYDVSVIVNKYPKAVGWLPLRVMSGIDMVVLIDTAGSVVKVVDLRPWKLLS